MHSTIADITHKLQGSLNNKKKKKICSSILLGLQDKVLNFSKTDIWHFRSEAGFLVAVLDVGTIFEAKFQRVLPQNMSF